MSFGRRGPIARAFHVDENWYEYGDLEMNLRTDVALAQACIKAANESGCRSKAVDYADFPIDTGTIVANAFLNPGGKIAAVVASNNLYHDFEKTEKLGRIAAEQAGLQGKRAAVVAIGGLSGRYFDHDIDIATDHIVREEDDTLNRALLEGMRGGDARLRSVLPNYTSEAKGDMGMKHMGWLLGAVGTFKGATVHGYGATYGAGAAAVEFHIT